MIILCFLNISWAQKLLKYHSTSFYKILNLAFFFFKVYYDFQQTYLQRPEKSSKRTMRYQEILHFWVLISSCEILRKYFLLSHFDMTILLLSHFDMTILPLSHFDMTTLPLSHFDMTILPLSHFDMTIFHYLILIWQFYHYLILIWQLYHYLILIWQFYHYLILIWQFFIISFWYDNFTNTHHLSHDSCEVYVVFFLLPSALSGSILGGSFIRDSSELWAHSHGGIWGGRVWPMLAGPW